LALPVVRLDLPVFFGGMSRHSWWDEGGEEMGGWKCGPGQVAASTSGARVTISGAGALM
jgi:hypothetical protein